MIILGKKKFKEEVFLPDYFNPKLTSFLIQIRARMYMYSIRPSTKIAFLSVYFLS